MLNLAIQNLPSDWEYVAWVDADISFSRPDWVQETIQSLQHYQFVQMFSHALDLGPCSQPIKSHRGFVYSWYNGLKTSGKYYEHAHPGFAWACRREALDHVGGLIDWAILGSADRHMAAALIGEAQTTLNRNLTKEYKDTILEWENRATKYIKHDIGFVNGTILHSWHGSKKNRKYSERWRILTSNQFNPFLDLKRDSQGLYQLTDRNLNLRDQIRKYFAERSEDSIDL